MTQVENTIRFNQTQCMGGDIDVCPGTLVRAFLAITCQYNYVCFSLDFLPCWWSFLIVFAMTPSKMLPEPNYSQSLYLQPFYYPLQIAYMRPSSLYNRPCVAQWLERPLGVREAGVRSPTASHQRRKNWEVCASRLDAWH